MKKTTPRKLVSTLLTLAICFFVARVDATTVKSVGSVVHGTDTQVTVVFSDPVDPVTGATPGNYTFTGGITVTGASMMTGLPTATETGVAENPAPAGRVVDNQCVVLTVTGLAAGATATITIQNVQDTSTPPNTVPTTTITFQDSGYKWAETGTAAIPGKVIAIGTNGFDIFSAGAAQWANYDEVTMVYKEVTGDFDLKARIEFQDFSSHWARAGIMARESLDLGENASVQATNASRYADVHGNPVQDFNQAAGSEFEAGNNSWESHIRRSTGGQTASDNATGGAPPYPNAWLRIQRTGNEIITSHGSDGVNWDPAADRTDTDWQDSNGDPLPLLPKLYVGPAFSPEVNNIFDTSHRNRLFLYQVRFTAITVPYVRLVDPNPCGVMVLIEDAPPPGTQVNTTTVQLSVDGNPVTASATKSGTTTTVAYKAASPYTANSSHSFELTFKDNAAPPNTQIIDRTFTIPNYQTLPAAYALATTPTTPGMAATIYQIDYARGPGDENSPVNAEEELAHGYVDPTTGTTLPNVAATGSANVDFVNWEQDGGDISLNPPQPDHFNSGDPAASPIPNGFIPGIPGSGNDQGHSGAEAGSANNNIVVEVATALQLSPGCYRMGVNSDDGFKVSVAPGTPDIFGMVLGSYNTGRGSSDTVFDFVVTTAGYYPFRLLWWEGSGGANVEWYAVNLDTGDRILINGPQAGAIKAFRDGQGRARVRSLLPANGYTGAQTNSPVQITLEDGSTTVVDGSISLWIDGNQVTPTIVNGPTTTVSYAGSYKFVTSHTGTLIWGESTTPQTMHTNNFSFQVRQMTPDDLPPTSFWIEAEDFDSTGTPVPDAVNTMPYDIGAGGGTGPYDGIGATLNVDYFNNDNLDNTNPTTYRSTGDPNTAGRSVDVASDPGANFGLRRAGGFDMSTNYKIGWGDSADWYNYTRKIPPGLYTAVVALSDGGDPIGTPNAMGGTLSMVTAGVGTTNQTLKTLGTFNGPSSGAWSYNNLVPFYAADGSLGVFKVTSSVTTLRFSLRAGDYDWFALVPVTGVPPKLTAASPSANTATPAASAVPKDAKIRLTVEDFSTATVQNLTKLFFDGADVTTSASIVKNADILTITYDPGGMAGGSTHTYQLLFTDNGTPAVTQTNTATFTVSAAVGTPGQFLIEAEDFDTGGGNTVAAASTMPYLGGAYAHLGAVPNVDYADSDGNDSRPYRDTLSPNANHDQQTDAGTLDVVRSDSWTMTANYKIGWVGDGDWFNYTRTFPANTYNVWVALSHDPTDGLRGSFSLVTAGVGTTNQTVFTLGSFNGPTSGAWGTDNLVEMKDGAGNPLAVSLSGTKTVRFNGSSGDYDYLLFTPTTATASKWITDVSVNGGNVTINWIGGGTLQSTPRLDTTPVNWTDLGPGSPAGTYTAPISGAASLYRVKE